MTIRKYLYIAIALVLGACSEQDVFDDSQEEMGRMPVLFSAGNTDAVITRASTSASYMPQDSRFVCSMFFHAGANDTDKSAFYDSKPTADVSMTTTWLKVNNSIGNAVYWNNKYLPAAKTDVYGFDETAKCFYWQNRLSHIFLALADYHKLSEDDGDTGSLKLYPDITTQYENQYMVAYDLTRGDKTAMKQQPDPIQAVETAQPSGATPEANRVKLFFKHQFSQVQVNLGNMVNRGIEFSADADIIQTKDLRFNLGLNLTFIKNKITKMPDIYNVGGEKDEYTAGLQSGQYNYRKGHSMYSFYTYTYKGIDDMTGRALYTFNDHDFYVPGMVKAGEDITNREAIPAEEYVVIDGVPYVYKPATYGKREWHGSAVPKF